MRHFVRFFVLMVFVVVGAGNTIGVVAAPPVSDEYAVLDQLAAAAIPVMLTFSETPIAQVFEVVRRASGVDIELKTVPEHKITIQTGKVSLKDALVQLARQNNLSYEVIGSEKLIVHGEAKGAG